jgi:hypothetical protein
MTRTNRAWRTQVAVVLTASILLLAGTGCDLESVYAIYDQYVGYDFGLGGGYYGDYYDDYYYDGCCYEEQYSYDGYYYW